MESNLTLNISGTVFAYGVTSSGKTHTMHVSVILYLTAFLFNFMISFDVLCSKPENRVSLFTNHHIAIL